MDNDNNSNTGASLAISEANSTIKRIELVLNNSNDPVELFMAYNTINEMKGMVAQLNALANHPEFHSIVQKWHEQYAKAMESPEK